MSMDLATLSHGLMPDTVLAELDDDFSGIVPPPQTCREEMLRYVDTFIKVFYLPNEVSCFVVQMFTRLPTFTCSDVSLQ